MKDYITGMSNWKASGPHRVQDFWFKRITNLQETSKSLFDWWKSTFLNDKWTNGPNYERPDQW